MFSFSSCFVEKDALPYPHPTILKTKVLRAHDYFQIVLPVNVKTIRTKKKRLQGLT